MSTSVCPWRGPVSAVNVSLKVLVLPAATWSGATSTLPRPGAAGLWAGTSSSTSPSTGTSARRWSFGFVTPGPLRVREAEVKQPPRVAVRIRRMQHDGDQPRAAAPGRRDQAMSGDRRPARLDAVGAPIGAEQHVLVDVRLCVGRLRP